MQKVTLSLLMTLLVLSMAAIVTASANNGAEKITVDGGSKGEVEFTHKNHQDRLEDCMVCHDVFPQELGVIKKMKSEKKLKRKQVMNDVCLACHKADKKAGKAYGPTSCNKCHSK